MLRKMLAGVALLPFLMVCASGCGNDESKNPKIQKAGTTLGSGAVIVLDDQADLMDFL